MKIKSFIESLKAYKSEQKSNKTEYITDVSSEEAIDLLMSSDQYHTVELPSYFDFDEILSYVRKKIGKKQYADCCTDLDAENLDEVNIEFLMNKDGKYALRPVVLANPYLYYFLVREVCGEGNWERVKDNFLKCKVPNISVGAMPVIRKEFEEFHKSTVILNWWEKTEQRSIELSLEYSYMFVSDITNCYGSISQETIDWALARRGTSSQTDENHDIADNIRTYLRAMQKGKNIGIPQGSTLFDLVAEIVLCYSDLLLYEKLSAKGITDGYYIIRYRDDYRVFSNDREMLDVISYTLQEVLESLNFKMNAAKTKVSDSIITDSIKADKLFYIYNTPIINKKGCDFDGLQKHLLYILMFGRKFNNGGQLRRMLDELDKRIKDMLSGDNQQKQNDTEKVSEKRADEKHPIKKGKIKENICALSAIAAEIAVENVNTINSALRVISRMVNSMDDKDKQVEIRDKVCKKLISRPNSTYTQVWLQNMTYKDDKLAKRRDRYDVKLCRVVMGEKLTLWNNSWLAENLHKNFPNSSIVDKKKLKNTSGIVEFKRKFVYDDVPSEEDIPRNDINSLD